MGSMVPEPSMSHTLEGGTVPYQRAGDSAGRR